MHGPREFDPEQPLGRPADLLELRAEYPKLDMPRGMITRRGRTARPLMIQLLSSSLISTVRIPMDLSRSRKVKGKPWAETSAKSRSIIRKCPSMWIS